jgi:hypothetical protein
MTDFTVSMVFRCPYTEVSGKICVCDQKLSLSQLFSKCFLIKWRPLIPLLFCYILWCFDCCVSCIDSSKMKLWLTNLERSITGLLWGYVPAVTSPWNKKKNDTKTMTPEHSSFFVIFVLTCSGSTRLAEGYILEAIFYTVTCSLLLLRLADQ